MEHNVYLCEWSRSADGFVLWVKATPRIRSAAQSYSDAEVQLITAIQDAGGAMCAVLEFDPPLPKTILEEKYSHPELFLIGGDDRFETDAPRWHVETKAETDERLRWSDAYYERPVCRTCRYTSGGRSEAALTLTYAPAKYDGAFGIVGTDGGPFHQIVSEEFLELLTPHERERLQFRPTIRRARRKFFELVGPEGPPHVMVAGMEVSGWCCDQCDHREWGYWVEGCSFHSFIAKADLSPSQCGVFTVGTAPEIQLAVTAARWKELVGLHGTRGFVSQPLGVVPDHDLIRTAELPLFKNRLKANV